MAPNNRPRYDATYTAERALEEFSTELDMAYALGEGVEQWATMLGLDKQTNALKLTFPLALDAAGYHKHIGDPKFRHLSERELSMEVEVYQDGVEEYVRKIERDPGWSGWNQAPAGMALEALRFPNVLAAAMLHANPLIDLYAEKYPGGATASTINLFHASHPVHIHDAAKGTFANAHTSWAGFTEAWAEEVVAMYETRKGPNGQPLGLAWTHVLVPPGYAQAARKFFESALLVQNVLNAGGTIIGGVTTENRYKGVVQVVSAPELLDTDRIYTLALNKGAASPRPWIVQRMPTPRVITFDASGERAKITGKVGVSVELEAAVAGAIPVAIDRWVAE